MLTRSSLTYPEVSSKVCHDSCCQLGNSVSLPWVIYYGTSYLHVVSSFSYIPVICLKLVLFLIPLQFVHLFCNQSKCILLFFFGHLENKLKKKKCITVGLLIFLWAHTLSFFLSFFLSLCLFLPTHCRRRWLLLHLIKLI